MKALLLILAIILTLSLKAQYCEPWISNSEDQIEFIAVGGYASATGHTSGHLYRHFKTDIRLSFDRLYLLSLAPLDREELYHWRIWIDMDRDSLFSDNELLFRLDSARGNVRGEMTLNNGLIGETRMRIMMRKDVVISPCDDDILGEVEDYTVILGSLTGVNEQVNEELIMYPNPVVDVLHLSKESEYVVYSMLGVEVLRGYGNKIPLEKGIYFVSCGNVVKRIIVN